MSHVILVAFEVYGDDEQTAQEHLMAALPRPEPVTRDLECWWVAEDQRFDRSDCESAVFVPLGMTQRQARAILEGQHQPPPTLLTRLLNRLGHLKGEQP